VIEREAGVMPVLARGPSRGKEMKSAKKLLALVENDESRAHAVIDAWAEDGWGITNAPSMAHVYSQSSELIFKLEMAKPEKKEGGYIRRKRSGGPTL